MEAIKLPKLRKVDPNKPKKKKILLLSDDLRMHSGIGTMSKEFVFGTIDKYDWVQLGAAVEHPEAGKIFDLSDAIDNIIDEQCASIHTRRVIIKDDFLKNIKRVIAKNNV